MDEPQLNMKNQPIPMMSRFRSLRSLLGAGLVLGTIATASAGTLVTFTLDMNAEANAIINNSTVYVRGSFNGQAFALNPLNSLTNNGAGVYSQTVNITDAPGTSISCKFYYNAPGDTWESGADRQFILGTTSQVLPLTAWNDKYPAPLNNVTFRISMTQQIALGTFTNNVPGSFVAVSGGFNGWSQSIDFTNNPAASGTNADIYSQTLQVAGFPGSTPGNYKFRSPIGDTWETISDRPSFTLTGGDQTLPLVFWNNLAPSTPTNNVTFQVDMTAQILLGNFTPGQFIRVSGGMAGWGDGVDLTNNPALSGNATNIYSTVIPVVSQTNVSFEYKFRANGGWENPTSTSGNNRSFLVAGGNQVLPLVFYSDASPCDLLDQFTTVTFFCQITNGTPATDGATFDGTNLKINGEFNGWAAWDSLLPTMAPAGSNDLYYHTTVLSPGAARAQKFKFSIGGPDNEAPSFQDHIQYVRSFGNAYELPAAKFGTNFAATRVEQAVSGLKIAPAGANVAVTWDGTPCVTLQTRTTMTGSWTDLPATETLSATNWPSTNASRFFRLQKRTTP